MGRPEVDKVLAAVLGGVWVSKGILCLTLPWGPGLGKATDSFSQPQATKKVGRQLGFQEGVCGGVVSVWE